MVEEVSRAEPGLGGFLDGQPRAEGLARSCAEAPPISLKVVFSLEGASRSSVSVELVEITDRY